MAPLLRVYSHMIFRNHLAALLLALDFHVVRVRLMPGTI